MFIPKIYSDVALHPESTKYDSDTQNVTEQTAKLNRGGKKRKSVAFYKKKLESSTAAQRARNQTKQ